MCETKDRDSRVERIESDRPTIHTSASYSVSHSKVIVDVRIHIPDDRVRKGVVMRGECGVMRGECRRARTNGRCEEARRRRTGVKVALAMGPPVVKVLHASDIGNNDERKDSEMMDWN